MELLRVVCFPQSGLYFLGWNRVCRDLSRFTRSDFTCLLTLFDMGFFRNFNFAGGGGRGMPPPNFNFVVFAFMITKFVTGNKLDVFDT